MADIKRIEYIDDNNILTTIDIFKKDLTGSTYEFTGGVPVVLLRWYGDEDKWINGSEAFIKVHIQNETDENNLLELFQSDVWYIEIKKSGQTFWYGRLNVDFFEQEYQSYPYTIELNASDQLGKFKDYQFIITDFPEVTWSTAYTYSIFDIIKLSLTDPSIIPEGSIYDIAPKYLNVGSRIKPNSGDTYFIDNVYVDPKLWFEGGEWESKEDILNDILEPLNMRLFQWNGEWWLLSKDIQFEIDFNYVRYTIQGAEINTVKTYTENIICPYITGTTLATDINEATRIQYKAPLRILEPTLEYKQNFSIFSFFRNDEGKFYEDHEFSGNTFLYQNNINNVAGYQVDLTPYKYGEDTGLAQLDMIRRPHLTNPTLSEINWLYFEEIMNIEIESLFEYNIKLSFNSLVDWSGSTETEFMVPIAIKVVVDGVDLWVQSFDGSLSTTYIAGTPSVIALQNYELDISIFSTPTGATIEKIVYYIGSPYRNDDIYSTTDHKWAFTNFKFYFDYVETNDKFISKNTKYILNNYSNQDKEDITLKLFLEGLIPGDAPMNVSTVRNVNGVNIDTFFKMGDTEKRTMDYLVYQNYYINNQRYRARILGDYKSYYMDPIRLFKDKENRIYNFINGSLLDQEQQWSVEYLEMIMDNILYGFEIETFISNSSYTYNTISLEEGDAYISNDNFDITDEDDGELFLTGSWLNEDDFYINENGFLIYTGA